MVGVLFLVPISSGDIFANPYPMSPIWRSRSFCTLLALSLGAIGSNALAQRVFGTFDRPVEAKIMVLYATRGTDHPPLDSTSIQPNGRFSFPERRYPAGFYQLGVNDSDRVDLILDPREAIVELTFSGAPLQRNIKVLASSENQRMWAYKLLSRKAQEQFTAMQEVRAVVSPLDTAALHRLDRQEGAIRLDLDRQLDSLTALVPEGQFAFAVDMDHRLDEALQFGPGAILKAFNFSDQRLLRSSSYTKAILYYIQNHQLITDSVLMDCCDSLLLAASRDTICWTYARAHLVELFTTYGPEEVAQHLVQYYIVGPGSIVPADGALLAVAADQLRLVIGAPAPDMILVTPGSSDTLHLAQVLPQYAHTGLFFYSSTCDHCHDQMPGLHALVEELDPSEFHLIGIALDTDVDEFRSTLLLKGINWPSYTELKGWGVDGVKAYNVKATPSLFVLDRAGKIVAKPVDHQAMRAHLLLNKR